MQRRPLQSRRRSAVVTVTRHGLRIHVGAARHQQFGHVPESLLHSLVQRVAVVGFRIHLGPASSSCSAMALNPLPAAT
jgi:hypothetical protein